MAESIRSVVVTIEVDTNKQTYERRLVQFEKRVVEEIVRLTEAP